MDIRVSYFAINCILVVAIMAVVLAGVRMGRALPVEAAGVSVTTEMPAVNASAVEGADPGTEDDAVAFLKEQTSELRSEIQDLREERKNAIPAPFEGLVFKDPEPELELTYGELEALKDTYPKVYQSATSWWEKWCEEAIREAQERLAGRQRLRRLLEKSPLSDEDVQSIRAFFEKLDDFDEEVIAGNFDTMEVPIWPQCFQAFQQWAKEQESVIDFEKVQACLNYGDDFHVSFLRSEWEAAHDHE